MEPADRRRVAGDPPQALDDVCGSVKNGIGELPRAIVPVNPETQLIAGRHILLARPANLIARDPEAKRRSLKAGDRLADLEAEFRVERERAVVPRHLEQAYTGNMASGGAIHDGLHQLAPYRAVRDPGSTDTGPMPAIADRSSRKLQPTIPPSSSATTE